MFCLRQEGCSSFLKAKKRLLKRITGIVVFFVLLWEGNYMLSGLYVPKDNSSGIIKEFYQQKKDTVDVLFFGSSHSYRSIMPMELWKDAGISAMNLGTSSQPFVATYYLMKDSLRRQSPKVVVLELYGSQYEEDYGAGNISLFQSAVNFIPLNLTKLELWWNQIRKDFSWKEQVEFLFPLTGFHMRWDVLTDTDYFYSAAYLQGGHPSEKLEKQVPGKVVTECKDLNETTEKYLKKMIDLCEKKQVPLIVFAAPMAAEFDRYENSCARINAACEYAEKRGVTVFRMSEVAESMDLDHTEDFYNSSHLNLFGALKLTKWFETYLTGHYEFQDHRKDPRYHNWEDALPRYEETVRQKRESLEKQKAGAEVSIENDEL